jgi:hypothetical protein
MPVVLRKWQHSTHGMFGYCIGRLSLKLTGQNFPCPAIFYGAVALRVGLSGHDSPATATSGEWVAKVSPDFPTVAIVPESIVLEKIRYLEQDGPV